jgi:cysteine dioxygenase
LSFSDAVVKRFGKLRRPSPDQLKEALTDLHADESELLPHLGEPGIYPYGRKPVFASDHVEVIAMNWAVGRECAPHDHGRSFGWIQVVCGTIEHTLHTLDQDDRPVAFGHRREPEGTVMFAPRNAVHSMANGHDGRTVTLHVYAPPIDGMVVYDLQRCLACVVANDCGAWWPVEQRQRLRVMRLGTPQTVDGGAR